MRMLPAAVAVGLLLPTQALAVSNEVSVDGRTITIEVPLAGTLSDSLSAGAERLSESTRRARVHGCIGVAIRTTPSEDGHRALVIPQRPGQFVRVVANEGDPYSEERSVMVGAHDLGTESGGERILNTLLLRQGSELLRGDVSRFGRELALTAVTDAAEGLDRQPQCRYRGTADITVRYRPYNLTVSTRLSYRFTVRADGTLKGSVSSATRQARAPNQGEIGDCSTDSAPLNPIRLTGGSDGEVITMEFSPRGDEPTIDLTCTNGTANISGDYIKAFLTEMEFVGLDARNGAVETKSAKVPGGPSGRGTFRIGLAE